MKDRAFYLKVNRKEPFALKNLSRWIDAAYLMNADCYIICDDDDLKAQIIESLLLYSEVRFIKSHVNKELQFIVDSIANRNWKNAAYAHLTSFWDSKERGYKFFWNIDADDTRMCVSIDRMVEILKTVEDYAESNKIECFSLDMWRSETRGKHWSFGITYISNQVEWLKICREKCMDEEYKKMDNEGNQNVDWFFTYLKSCNISKIETFYVENMKFIHYSNDFFEKPIGSGLYHWKNGKLNYPILFYGLGIEDIGEYYIAPDIIKIDIGIKDTEGTEILAYYAREGKDLSSYYCVDHIVNQAISGLKSEVFLKKHGFSLSDNPEIVCFGAGNALEKNLNKIKKIYDLKTVCDNDESKWGKEVMDGITCISPIQLSDRKNVIVIILVYSRSSINQISKQLEEMSVKYDFMDNWLMCVE